MSEDQATAAEADVTSVDASVEPETTETAVPETEATENQEAEVESEGKQEPDKKIARKSYENRQLKRQLKAQTKQMEQMAEKLDAIQQRMEESSKPNAPKLEDFGTVEEYIQAAFEHDKKSSSEPKGKEQSVDPEYQAFVEDSREFLLETGSEKYEDFEEVVLGDTSITEVMRDAMFEMDNQVEIAYYLGKNPKEAKRIAKMPPIRQVAEIGKLDAKSWSPSKPKTSKAPSPIDPVGGNNTPNDEIQPVEDYASFLKKRNKQLGRK